MKTLIALSVLQTIGIVVLLLHVIDNERGPASTLHAANPATIAPSPFASRSDTPAALADEGRLRAIIQEELAAQLKVRSHDTVPPPAAVRDEASDRLRQERIAQQIEAYQAAGSITDAQMQELQAQIAGLDDASRKRMMSKLIRAMNSGDIKGRL